MSYSVVGYIDPAGSSPFRDFLNDLDFVAKQRVQARIFRFELGNLGDTKLLGGGVYEARLMFGPGTESILLLETENLFCFWEEEIRDLNARISHTQNSDS